MQKRKLILFILVFCSLGFTNVFAQRTLTVKESSGASTSINLIDIGKITFGDGNITITKIGASSSIIAIQDISVITFDTTATNIQAQSIKNEAAYNLYPNPVRDYFIVGGNSLRASDIIVEVIDLQGKVILHQIQKSNNRIDVSELKKGIYICRIHSLDKIENIKFIKH